MTRFITSHQAARIIANLLVAGGGVLFRAAAQAYRQAVVSEHTLRASLYLLCIRSRPRHGLDSFWMQLETNMPRSLCCRCRKVGRYSGECERGAQVGADDRAGGAADSGRGEECHPGAGAQGARAAECDCHALKAPHPSAQHIAHLRSSASGAATSLMRHQSPTSPCIVLPYRSSSTSSR